MDEVLKKCIDEAKKNPKISLWSPKASAALRFLKKTTPEFSISREAAKLLEEAVKSKYPEIWKAVEEAMKE
jgi:histone H3/H4